MLKKNDSLSAESVVVLGLFARHLCLLSTFVMVFRYVCHNSSAYHAYVMWAELGHSHILYVPAISNKVTTGNSTGTKNV